MQSIIDWIVGLMETLGAPGVGIAILLENLFPPIPSEVVLPLAGFTVAQGSLNMVNVFIWSVLGSVIGAYVLYGVGAWLGLERLRKIADWMWLVKASDVDAAPTRQADAERTAIRQPVEILDRQDERHRQALPRWEFLRRRTLTIPLA